MLNTSANRATVSQRPTTVMYWEKPLPVSANASAPAAPALPWKTAGAAGADALAETGKGFSQYITVVGLCETVALFALVFSMVALG